MGRLTKTQIISQALTKHGNTNNTSAAGDWFDDALDDIYRNRQWDFLLQRAQSLTFSGRNANCPSGFLSARRVTRVLNQSPYHLIKRPLAWIEQDSKRYTSNQAPRWYGENTSAATNQIVLEVTPDQGYTWDMDYFLLPARITGADTPIFPSDRVLIQAVYVEALRQSPVRHKSLETEEARLGVLIAVVARTHALRPEEDDELEPDPEVFNLGPSRRMKRWYGDPIAVE